MSFKNVTKSRRISSTPSHHRPASSRIDFKGIGQAALPHLLSILQRWLPDGYVRGSEWIARNPRRDDKHIGSFSINISSGRWADFASGDAGGDIVSLAAYLYSINQAEAARRVAGMIGIGVRRG